jgi:hypothetical protein
MKTILENLALIDLNKFCRENGIDYEGTHLIKNGRGYKYSLVKNDTGKEIVSVIFKKHSVPEHYFYPDLLKKGL